MANSDHIQILQQGAKAWNQWREATRRNVTPDLREASLTGMDLRLFDFSGALLNGALFNRSDMRGANFANAKLDGNPHDRIGLTILKARMADDGSLIPIEGAGANLGAADLRDTDFRFAELRGAIFTQADLRQALLTGADLRKTNLMGAMLHGADIRCADFSKAQVGGIEYDNTMYCRGAIVDSCIGSQRFSRHVKDLDYIQETKTKHPSKYRWWKILSDCGRSWLRLALWCCVILYSFWAIFDILKVEHPLVTSIMAFTSFGFVDSSMHTTAEFVLICTEAVLGYVMFGALVSLIASQMGRRSG